MKNHFEIYMQGIAWFILSLVSSAINDVIQKYASVNLGSMEVTFLRFFFSTMVMIPFIFYYGAKSIKTSHPYIQISRGVLLFIGMASWIYGLKIVPVSTATAVSFSVPLFVLVLAIFFLKENIIWQRWFATIIGFVGMFVTLHPGTESFNNEVLIFVAAALAFASLDIINKKYVIKESMICMLFYSALITALLAFPFAYAEWKTPEPFDLFLLFLLGCSANLILFFLLKAFSLVDATAVAPYRYFEIVVSSIVAYMVFAETPSENTLYGVMILIPTTLFIAMAESRKKRKAKKAKDIAH
jgi:S-adenosylmethionine uptake transporter